jgi:endonuclease III
MDNPSQTSQQAILDTLLERHGGTFSAELGIDLSQDTPEPLYRWLTAALLLSARISSAIAVRAARALGEAGWTTAEKMAGSTWEDRVHVLNRSGYARYDESTARRLGEAAQRVIDDYGGDLRRLRDRAERQPEKERRLLKEFKGIGDVGADIFFREMQSVWDELYPFADKRALAAAKRLGLPDTAEGLAAIVERGIFSQLVAALVRCDLAGDDDDIRQHAESGRTE